MNNIRIDYCYTSCGFTYCYIHYEDGMWLVVDKDDKSQKKIVAQSKDIRFCIKHMFLYLKCYNGDDYKNESFLIIYTDAYNKKSGIPIYFRGKIRPADEMREVILQFIDTWEKS